MQQTVSPNNHPSPFVGVSAQGSTSRAFPAESVDLSTSSIGTNVAPAPAVLVDYNQLNLSQTCPSTYAASNSSPVSHLQTLSAEDVLMSDRTGSTFYPNIVQGLFSGAHCQTSALPNNNFRAHPQNDYGSHQSQPEGSQQYVDNVESMPPDSTVLNNFSLLSPTSSQLADGYVAFLNSLGPEEHSFAGQRPDYNAPIHARELGAQAQFGHHDVITQYSTGTNLLDIATITAVAQDSFQHIRVYSDSSNPRTTQEIWPRDRPEQSQNYMLSGVGADLLATSNNIISNGIYSAGIPRGGETVSQAHGTLPLSIRKAPTAVNHVPSSVTPRKRGKITKGQPTKTRSKPCRWCKVAKVKCTGPLCEACHKRYGPLATTICVRYEKTVHDIRKAIEDFYSLKDRPLPERPTSDHLTVRKLVLVHPLQQIGNQVVYFPNSPKLEVTCFEYEGFPDLGWLPAEHSMQHIINGVSSNPSKAAAVLHELESTFRMLQHSLLSYRLRPKPYILDSASLPSYQDLVAWGSFDIIDKHNIAPTDVESALTAFLAAYADERRHPLLEHRDFVRKVLELVSLSRMFDARRPVDSQGQLSALSNIALNESDEAQSGPTPLKSMSAKDFGAWKISASLPGPARTQLFTHIANLIQPLELEVLEEIDKYIAKRDKANGFVGDPLIYALCIRRLCLHYRRSVLRYGQFGLTMVPRRDNNKLILEQLTMHYAHVFKGTLSPFHDEWRAEKHESLLGHDSELARLFEDVKAAEHYHFLNEQDDVVDNLYKHLVTEHQTKRHSTLAKQWFKGGCSFNDLGLASVRQHFQRWALVAEDPVGSPRSRNDTNTTN
ncbi:hypothetical protein F4860DRAFT_497329 [Xylaria cubensis]|nr:hypothetical protein F4860DRAFT_497329 [Xylaria cubensis]